MKDIRRWEVDVTIKLRVGVLSDTPHGATAMVLCEIDQTLKGLALRDQIVSIRASEPQEPQVPQAPENVIVLALKRRSR